MRGWLALACFAACPAHADIVFVMHVYDAVEQYHCAWADDQDFRHLTVTCSSLDWYLLGGDLFGSSFDDRQPGYWRYEVTIDGVPFASGMGCSFEVTTIDSDPRGALLHCL